MALSRIPGFSLLSDLDRQGVDLQFTTNTNPLAYMDFTNFRLGVNQSAPAEVLSVNGNILVANGHVLASANISQNLGNVNYWWNNIWAANINGTIQTANQPNITTVGNITNLNITGNLTVGGITLANVTAQGNLNASNNRIIYVGTPVNSTDAATKGYVDAQIVGASLGNIVQLGTPIDGSLTGANAAYQGFTTTTSVTDAIDILNSVAENLFTNTFVRTVTFSSNVTAGGAGQTILLTMVPQGNVNQYVINWGDGTSNTTTSASTATHTYATNVGTPFTVIVTATNTNGASPSNTASSTISNYIQIYGANPVLSFSFYNTTTNGTILTGNNLYAIQGNVIYFLNTSTNTNTATVTWSINWGDANTTPIATNSVPGGVLGGNIGHIYTTNTGTGQLGVNLALLTDNIANPAILPMYSNVALKVYGNAVSPPAGLNTKTLTFTGSVGTSPTLAATFIDNTGGTTLTAGTSVSRTIATGTALVSAASGNVSSSYTYTANVGNVSAIFNGGYAGNVNLAITSTSTISVN